MLLWGIILTCAALGAAGICAGAGAFASLGWLWMLPVSFLGCFLGLTLGAFLFLWGACQLVDMKKPQERDSQFYRAMANLYIDAIIAVARVHVHKQGMEKLPQSGRFLLVCNHASDADPAILLAAFRKSRLAFISKRENEKMFIVGRLMRKLLCQSINRENDREALKTIVRCIQLIREDLASVAVFPEGYIHDDRKLHHFRHGVFKIAQRAKVPVVVCTLKGTPPVFRNAFRLKPTHIDLHLLAVISPEEFEGKTTVELGERVYRMMADDLGPGLVAEE